MIRVALFLCLLSPVYGVLAGQRYRYIEDSSIQLPPLVREFRGAWIATVANIDWPSKPGLPVAQQKTEMIAILDRARQLRMNAVILQVRPTSDTIYPSKLEPWSYYLTGKMGQPPKPYYDPLAFTISEAKKRMLEVHAWFNPFRARHPSAKGNVSPQHITQQRPDLIRRYGSLEWLDPGDPQVQAHSLRVILDVLKRYDVDGVHIDDYFYPYPLKRREGGLVPFPDTKTFARYRRAGGKLALDDWRRDNVNRFVKHLYTAIKREKPWVSFGISPFGIWRPGYPKSIKGMDAYATLYADALTWWQLGWVDYLTPQLYWSIEAPGQSFPVLLNWWAAQNKQGRHLWPGMSVRGTTEDRHPFEILKQVGAARSEKGVSGHVHYGMNSILTNRMGIAHYLQNHAYQKQALVPASPWLTSRRLPKPKLMFGARENGNLAAFHWKSRTTTEPKYWVIQEKLGTNWTTTLLPGGQKSKFVYGPLATKLPDAVAVIPVDRYGLAGDSFRARKHAYGARPAQTSPAPRPVVRPVVTNAASPMVSGGGKTNGVSHRQKMRRVK